MHYQPFNRCCWTVLRNIRGSTFLPRYKKNVFIFREFVSRPITLRTFPSSVATLGLKETPFSEAELGGGAGSSNNVSMSSEETKVPTIVCEDVDIMVDRRHTASNALDTKILNCNSCQELLEISAIQTLLLKHACLILHRLGKLSETDKSIKFDTLLENKDFAKMCNLVQRADYSSNLHLLFAALQGLENLGVLESSEIHQILNIELKWGMRRCQMRYLIRSIALFGPSMPFSSNKSKPQKDNKLDIVELAIHTIQRRWVEIVSGSDFNAVFRILQLLDEDTKGKLEDRAIEMVPTFTPSEMRQIFVTMAVLKRRPTPLLRTLAFHFAKSVDSSSAKDLIELAYALNELTFADPILMEKILSNLCPSISSIQNTASISSLVTSLGQIRYKHAAIMRLLDEWMAEHLKNLRLFDCAAWILTSAVLNHRTETTKMVCEHFKSMLSPKNVSSHVEWINMVHSLLVLDYVSDDLLATTLSPEVITSIENMGSKSCRSKIKLLNINAAAKYRVAAGYKGPFLNQKFDTQWASSTLHTSDQKLAAIALETMNSFLSPDKYLTLNQNLTCGVFVDAICMLNKNMEPVSHVESKRSKTPCQPAAIVIEGYSCMTLGNKEATGQTILNRKLLEKAGYKVVSIPYTEFSSSEKLIKRAKYLEQKLKLLSN